MFEQFVKRPFQRPFHLALYRTGPYAEERSGLLAHLVQEGRCLATFKVLNWLLLEVTKRVYLSGWTEAKQYPAIDNVVIRDVVKMGGGRNRKIGLARTPLRKRRPPYGAKERVPDFRRFSPDGSDRFGSVDLAVGREQS